MPRKTGHAASNFLFSTFQITKLTPHLGGKLSLLPITHHCLGMFLQKSTSRLNALPTSDSIELVSYQRTVRFSLLVDEEK